MRKPKRQNATRIESQNGKVIFYMVGHECIDIDIDDSVEELRLEYPEMRAFKLQRHKSQVYQNIKKIYISNQVMNISFSNTTFPNVREVISDSLYFDSGKMLIKKNPNSNVLKEDRSLQNAFCLDSDEIIDLTGITRIEAFAFSGCKSINIINSESVVYINNDAFRKSFFDCAHIVPVNGVAIAGTLIVDTDESASTYMIPQDVTAARMNIRFNLNAEMIVNNITVFFRSIFALHSWTMLPQKITLNGDEQIAVERMAALARFPFLEELRIDEDNTQYIMNNNVLYTKDGTELLACVKSQSGDIVVMEGVKKICKNAFSECKNITSVIMPDTVEMIDDDAFNGCVHLTSVRLSQNLKVMGISCFKQCNSLSEVDIPASLKILPKKAFSYCVNLKEIRLHEGLEAIHAYAFGSTSIKSLDIPKSINHLAKLSLLPASHITFHSKEIPDNVILAIARVIHSGTIVYDKYPLQIDTPDGRYILPAGIKDSASNLLNDMVMCNGLVALTDSYEYGISPIVKQNAAFLEYDLHRTSKSKTYVARNGKRLAERMVKRKNQDDLVRLIHFGILSNATLNYIYNIIPDDMTEAKAYALNAINGTKKTRFSL